MKKKNLCSTLSLKNYFTLFYFITENRLFLIPSNFDQKMSVVQWQSICLVEGEGLGSIKPKYYLEIVFSNHKVYKQSFYFQNSFNFFCCRFRITQNTKQPPLDSSMAQLQFSQHSRTPHHFIAPSTLFTSFMGGSAFGRTFIGLGLQVLFFLFIFWVVLEAEFWPSELWLSILV